jgi:hypothetical protein
MLLSNTVQRIYHGAYCTELPDKTCAREIFECPRTMRFHIPKWLPVSLFIMTFLFLQPCAGRTESDQVNYGADHIVAGNSEEQGPAALPETPDEPGAETSSSTFPATEQAAPATGDESTASTASLVASDESWYRMYSNAMPPHKNYSRATLETLIALGIGTTWYYLDRGNQADYDHDVDMDNLKGKFITGDGYSYDNNPWVTNVNHVTAGTVYYLLARSNDLSMLESFLYSTGASLLWEYGTEIHEDVSINDSIMNPFGGFAVGEVMYQLGEFFQHGEHNKVNEALGILFGAPSAFHRWLDNDRPKNPAHVDRFGFTTDVWHRFRLSLGYVAAQSNEGGDSGFQNEVQAGADLELINLSQYNHPGTDSSFYAHSLQNALTLRGSWNGDGWQTSLLRFKTVPLGYYWQDIVAEENAGQLCGYSFILGGASSFEYITNKFSEFEHEDKQAVVNIFGPSLDLTLHRSGWRVRGVVEASPNFAMLRPYSAEEFNGMIAADMPGNDLRRVYGMVYKYHPSRGPYYYSFGATAGGRLEVGYGPFEVEGYVLYHYFDSVSGPMRNEGYQRIDLNYSDERLSASLGVSCRLPFDNLRLAFVAEKNWGESELGSYSMDAEQTRLITSLVYEF